VSVGVYQKNTLERGKAMLLVLFHSCLRLRTVVDTVEDSVVEESPPMCVYEAGVSCLYRGRGCVVRHVLWSLHLR